MVCMYGCDVFFIFWLKVFLIKGYVGVEQSTKVDVE